MEDLKMTDAFDEEEFLELLMVHLDYVTQLFKADDCAIRRLHQLLRKSKIPYLVAPDDHNDFMIVFVRVNGNECTEEYRITHDPSGRSWLRISKDGTVIDECLSPEEVFEILKRDYGRAAYVSQNGFFGA